MTQSEYITLVKNILNSKSGKIESVKKVYELKLPENPNPLLALIHGDSYEYIWTLKAYRGDMFDDEIEEFTKDLPSQIIQKLQSYLSDWDDKCTYRYSFSLKAQYNLYKDSRNKSGLIQDRKYVRKDLPNAVTVDEAIQATKSWKEELPSTQRFNENQTFGHKRQGMATCFDIYTTKKDGTDKLLLSGVLSPEFNYLVTSWLVDTL